MDIENTKKQIEEQFQAIGDTLKDFFEEMEKFRHLSEDWAPSNEEEMKACMEMGQDIDGRVNFILRQIMLRYGNMLFL